MKKNFYLIVYAFIMIFAPPIIPKINLLILLTIFTAISISVSWNEFYSKALLNKNIVSFYFILLFFFMITILVNSLFNGGFYLNNSFKILYKLIILIPSQYICSIFLIYKCRKINSENEYLYSILIKAGLVQSLISIIAFISPRTKTFLITVMSNNTGSDVFFQNTIYSSASDFRFFGFSSTLLDTFGYGMGILCFLALYLGLSGKIKYFFYLIVLLIPILLNSISGLLIFAVAVLAYLIFSIKRVTLKNAAGIFFVILILVISINPILSIIEKYSPNTLVWIESGFSNLFSFVLKSEKSNYEISDVLFSKRFWTFPKNSSTILFGSGHDVYGVKDLIGFHSDVGYVNQFWIGGIMGELLILSFLVFIFMKCRINIKKFASNELKILYILFILLFIMNVKADLLSYNPGMIINICLICNYLFLAKDEVMRDG